MEDATTGKTCKNLAKVTCKTPQVTRVVMIPATANNPFHSLLSLSLGSAITQQHSIVTFFALLSDSRRTSIPFRQNQEEEKRKKKKKKPITAAELRDAELKLQEKCRRGEEWNDVEDDWLMQRTTISDQRDSKGSA